MSITDGITARIATADNKAKACGVTLRPPLLVLGISERVGSNWLADTVRSSLVSHVEPLRQQIASSHPLSALNPDVVDVNELAGLGNLSRHWLETFVVSKHADRRHMVKETNLFFATRSLLRLFPESPAIVLTRDPVGIASSIFRGDLWARWQYRDRYDQLVATTQRVRHRRWAALVPDDAPTPATALARLVVLNTMLLAEALIGRDHTVISYERHVHDPAGVLRDFAKAVPEGFTARPNEAAPPTVGADDTFATTTAKTELVAYLDSGQAREVHVETARRLRVAAALVDPETVRLASSWLISNQPYRLAPPGPAPAARVEPTRTYPYPVVRYVEQAGVAWRNLLISNDEYCRWLNLLHDAGIPNTHGGTHLFLTVMPHERGGRIAWVDGRWRVSPGYEDHPVYWMTWIGAAAYAAWDGARLPTHAELDRVTLGQPPTNVAYTVGDVAPVFDPRRRANDLHHLVGNLQVWCIDGPDSGGGRPLERYLHGAAWNTGGTRDEITALRSRHLLGSSRGVGVRLVRDPGRPRPTVPPAALAARLHRWIDGPVADSRRSLSQADRWIVKALVDHNPMLVFEPM